MKPLRQAMPRVTEFLDALREDSFFPRQQINDSIRAGIDGQPTFFASENGHVIGTPAPIDHDRCFQVSKLHLTKTNVEAT